MEEEQQMPQEYETDASAVTGRIDQLMDLIADLRERVTALEP